MKRFNLRNWPAQRCRERGIYSTSPPKGTAPTKFLLPLPAAGLKRAEARAPAPVARPRRRSADFQSAVSQVSNLQAVGMPGSFAASARSADWKSAIRQVGNLRYNASLPAHPHRPSALASIQARRIRLANLAQRHVCVRVLLHVLVFARTRRNLRWHLNCIGHEFYGRRFRK